MRRAPATHRTKRPEGHSTTQGSTTQRHACGGLQPHAAQSTPMGTTLYKAARHKAMLAAGSSHTPHKAPRWARHYTKQHDTKPCLRRAPATHRTKRPKGHNTTQGNTSRTTTTPHEATHPSTQAGRWMQQSHSPKATPSAPPHNPRICTTHDATSQSNTTTPSKVTSRRRNRPQLPQVR